MFDVINYFRGIKFPVTFCPYLADLEISPQVMVGMVPPKRSSSENNSACNNYITMEDKVSF